MPVSSHSHSGEFCTHGLGSLEEIVRRAIELGFTHYGLSEHMPRYRTEDLYENEIQDDISPSDLVKLFDQYTSEARRLQQKYKQQIKLIVGMETEFIGEESLVQVKELKAQYCLDYLVGSIHHVDGMQIDYSEEGFALTEQKCGGTEELMSRYYDQQYKMMKGLQPEVIGHFDVIHKYRKSYNLSNEIWDKVKRNIEYGIAYGALFEVNTADRLINPFPQPDILKVLISSGAMITISDDSHYPGGVGWWYGQLSSYLQGLGVNQLFYLEACYDDAGQAIHGKTVLRKMDNCWQHSFWGNEKLFIEP